MVVSEESGSVGYDHNGNDNMELDLPLEQQEGLSKDSSHPSMNSTKHNSIFSLTLDEIQCKSGRNFGSMNMDEFLANIWSVEEDQEPSKGDQDSANEKDTTFQPKTLSRQGSFCIPTPLCKKTVDEVWSEIDKSRPRFHDPSSSIGSSGPSGPPQRQQTIGEITLEDFLVKAGVVQESPSKSKPSEKRVASTPIQLHCGNRFDADFGIGGQVFASAFLNPQNAMENELFSGNGYPIGTTYPMFGTQSMGESFCLSDIEKCHSLPESSSGGGAKNKKRIIDGPPEVVVERRQRRMIKNRESAARSRARKQAYTVELEAELNQLKEENTRLKQSVDESEKRRKQEVLRRKEIKQSTRAQKLAEKLRTMRRAVSLP
ncbi:hypothetical protein FF2_029653 [Malus domestica]